MKAPPPALSGWGWERDRTPVSNVVTARTNAPRIIDRDPILSPNPATVRVAGRCDMTI